MRATIRNIIEAKRLEREESGEAGFSLIELIVVVVILGVLAAIAIPIFMNIQGQAKQNSLATITANASSQAASALAQNRTYTSPVTDATTQFDFSNLTKNSNIDGLSLAISGTTTDGFCVTGSATGLTAVKSGPGC